MILKGAILQAITENFNVNAVIVTSSCSILAVVAAVDQP